MILFAEHLAALVKLADVDADVVPLRVEGGIDHLLRGEANAVDTAERGQKRQRDCRRGGQTADRKTAFDHAADAEGQRMLFLKRPRRAAQIVRPVVLLARDGCDMPLRALFKLQGRQLHDAVFLAAIGKMNTLVDCKAGDLAEIVIRMRADRADPVGTEAQSLGIPVIQFKKALFAKHGVHQSRRNRSRV